MPAIAFVLWMCLFPLCNQLYDYFWALERKLNGGEGRGPGAAMLDEVYRIGVYFTVGVVLLVSALR